MSKCDNCKIRKFYAKAFDLHWLGEDDCPYECDKKTPDHIGDVTEMVASKKCIDCQRDCQMIGCDMKACASYEPPKDGEA